MNNQTQTSNKFMAINWSNYSRSSYGFKPVESFKEALMDCDHTHEFSAEAQSWKEYSEILEYNADGDCINSTYFVTL